MPGSDSQNLKTLRWTDVVSTLAQIIQVLAIISTGIWVVYVFAQTRENKSRVEIINDITSFPATSQVNILHVSTIIKNIGKVAVNPLFAEVKVQQVCPLAQCLGSDDLGRPCPKDAINNNADPSSGIYQDFPWPELGYKSALFPKNHMVIEPGEETTRAVDFAVDQSAQLVRIVTFISEKKDGSSGWPSEALHRMPVGKGGKDDWCGSSFGSLAPRDGDSAVGSDATTR
jgi:hypothetical protein